MSYSNILDHHSMALDETRNQFYQKAINAVVNESSIVMDLGAGLGVHGLMALQAGAKKAYFVEPAVVVKAVDKLIQENALKGQGICLQSTVEEIQLEEKVDVISSVFTGNFLLTEDLLPSLFFARDNFLNEGGRLIPECGVMEIAPVSMAGYYEKYIDCWASQAQAINFDSIRDYAVNTLYYDTPDRHQSSFLAQAATLLELNFMTATEASCKSAIQIEITEDGLCHGWLGWFKIGFNKQWLSTSPKEKETHWSQVYLPLGEVLRVKKGEVINFELNRPEFGEWTWITTHLDKTQRHSSFLGGPLTSETLQKQSTNTLPILSRKGQVLQEVLLLMDGSSSKSQMSASLLKSYPELFRSLQQAEGFINKIVDEYC